jgi:hypothetical protein
LNLARISSRYVSRPYQLGVADCFRVVVEHLTALGIVIPDEFEGVTLATYPALFEANPDEAKAVMVRFLDSVLAPVHPNFALPGDILYLETPGKPPFTAILAGNALAISAAPGIGVRPLPLQHYKKLRGWRCQPQSRS